MLRIFAACVFLLLTMPQSSAAEIDWRVKHPFRFFSVEADFNMQREAMASVLATGGALAAPVSRLERLVNDPRWLREWYKTDPARYPDPTRAGRAERGWAHHINRRRATCWDARQQWHSSCDTDSFGGRQRTDYVLPPAHTVVFSVIDAPAGTCRWQAARPVFIAGTTLARNRDAPCDATISARIPFEPDVAEDQRGVEVTVTLPDGAQLAAERVWVRDRLIVGIGDSYSSGEGNPDTPVEVDPRPRENGTNISFVYDAGEQKLRSVPAYSLPTRYKNAAAGWLDRKCHRSAYSYHLRTALQIALADPKHSAVTFLGYACSGAEVTEGFLLPYVGAEGVETSYFTADGKARRDLPQLDRLMIELCRDVLTPSSRKRVVRLDQPITHAGRTIREVRLLDCPADRFLRPIDMMIVSIGGNDVGFTPLIVDVLTKSLPKYVPPMTDFRALQIGAPVFNRLARLVKAHDVPTAETKARELPARFAALRKALAPLPIRRSGSMQNIVLTAFPKVEFNQNGKLCGETDPRERMEGLNVGGVLTIDVPELRKVSKFVNDTLYPTLKKAASDGNWYFAESHRNLFATHGVCAQKRSASGVSAIESLMLPYFYTDKKRYRWFDFDPLSAHRDADFALGRDTRPYAPRQRWFRTLNDICMFVHYKRSGSPPSDRRFNLGDVMESCLGGPFHPTAEGHSRIADAVYETARAMLQLPDPKVGDLRQY